MTAIAGGPPIPLLHTDRHTHTLRHEHRIPGVQSDSSEPEGTETFIWSLCHRGGNRKSQLHNILRLQSAHTNTVYVAVYVTCKQTWYPECCTCSWGFESCACVFVGRERGRCLRCDWETILVRLRPRESTWLDMLLAVDRGCLVRTRPVLQGKKQQEMASKCRGTNTVIHYFAAKWSREATEHCW